MRFHGIGLGITALAVAALAFAQAAAKPNFSGTWKLDRARSDFGAMPAPASRIDKITHADPELKDDFSQSGQMGDVSAQMKYSTDGKETTNRVHENDITSTAKWDGEVLVIASKLSMGGAELTINDRWLLSADGKTLTIERHANSPMGETNQKIVLEKQ